MRPRGHLHSERNDLVLTVYLDSASEPRVGRGHASGPPPSPAQPLPQPPGQEISGVSPDAHVKDDRDYSVPFPFTGKIDKHTRAPSRGKPEPYIRESRIQVGAAFPHWTTRATPRKFAWDRLEALIVPR